MPSSLKAEPGAVSEWPGRRAKSSHSTPGWAANATLNGMSNISATSNNAIAAVYQFWTFLTPFLKYNLQEGYPKCFSTLLPQKTIVECLESQNPIVLNEIRKKSSYWIDFED